MKVLNSLLQITLSLWLRAKLSSKLKFRHAFRFLTLQLLLGCEVSHGLEAEFLK